MDAGYVKVQSIRISAQLGSWDMLFPLTPGKRVAGRRKFNNPAKNHVGQLRQFQQARAQTEGCGKQLILERGPISAKIFAKSPVPRPHFFSRRSGSDPSGCARFSSFVPPLPFSFLPCGADFGGSGCQSSNDRIVSKSLAPITSSISPSQ